MADIKFGGKTFLGIEKINIPLADGSGYVTFGQGGGVSLDSVVVFVGDYYADELTVDIGALDKYERTIVT